MATSVYHISDSDSTDTFNPDLSFDPDIRVIAIDGEPCEVWYEAGYHYVKRLSTEDIYRFKTINGFRTFTDTHQWENEPEPSAPIAVNFIVREVAKIAAVSTPTDEHIIKIAAPIDTTDCESCRETLTSGRDVRLCEKCNRNLAHELRNEQRSLFMAKMPLAEFQAKWKNLQAQIADLDAEYKQSHIGYGTASQYFQKTDIATALIKFQQKYMRKPTNIRISKYDHIPAEVDATDIDVARSGAVLPGDVWVGAR